MRVFHLCFRVNVDGDKDEQEYEDEIVAEILDVELEAEEEYQRKLTEHKQQLEEWKAWRNKQVFASSQTSLFKDSLYVGEFYILLPIVQMN